MRTTRPGRVHDKDLRATKIYVAIDLYRSKKKTNTIEIWGVTKKTSIIVLASHFDLPDRHPPQHFNPNKRIFIFPNVRFECFFFFFWLRFILF